MAQRRCLLSLEESYQCSKPLLFTVVTPNRRRRRGLVGPAIGPKSKS